MYSLRDDSPNKIFSNGRWLSYLLGASLAIVCGAALADSKSADVKKEAVTDPAQLMKFENTRVENVAPVPVAKSTTASQGMRAFVDQTTGQLHTPTADDANQLSAAAPKKQANTTLKPRSLQAAGSAADTTGTTVYGVDGSIGMTLDEETMVFHVAHRHGNGVVLQEATGKSAAEQSVQKGAVVKSEEVSNDR